MARRRSFFGRVRSKEQACCRSVAERHGNADRLRRVSDRCRARGRRMNEAAGQLVRPLRAGRVHVLEDRPARHQCFGRFAAPLRPVPGQRACRRRYFSETSGVAHAAHQPAGECADLTGDGRRGTAEVTDRDMARRWRRRAKATWAVLTALLLLALAAIYVAAPRTTPTISRSAATKWAAPRRASASGAAPSGTIATASTPSSTRWSSSSIRRESRSVRPAAAPTGCGDLRLAIRLLHSAA